MKNKYRFLPIIIFTSLFLVVSFASALEVPLPGLSEKPTLPEYVVYFFKIGISLAGILALISFTVGAIGLISPNIEAHNDAKDRMKGAILGLVLTFASFVIIQTINPTLTSPYLTPLPGLPGVSYWDGQKTAPVDKSVSDTSTRPEGFNSIIYKCTDSRNQGPALLLWKFTSTGLEDGNKDLSGVVVDRITCGGQSSIGAFGSFKMAFETSGIYYYIGANCTGYASPANTSSQESIYYPFNENIRSVKIINDAENHISYGVIFHEVEGLSNGGGCNLPITGSLCKPVDEPSLTSAADIFATKTDNSSAGDGVSFYSEPFGPGREANAGFYNVGSTTIKAPYLKLSANNIIFTYTGIDATTEKYIASHKTFQASPGSMSLKGNYLVAIYSSVGVLDLVPRQVHYCQTFNRSTENYNNNLNTQPITASGAKTSPMSIYIIPNF